MSVDGTYLVIPDCRNCFQNVLFIARTNGSVVLFGDTESAGIFAADVLVFYRDAGVGGVIGSKRGGRRRCDRSYRPCRYL